MSTGRPRGGPVGRGRARVDLADLRDRYREWCRTVSFDNALRWLSLRDEMLPPPLAECVPDGSLPGVTPAVFRLAHERHGVGGMCIPTTYALCDRLRAVGYDAQVVAGAIDGSESVDHVTTIVTLGRRRYALDTVGMTDQPIPLAAEPVTVGEGLGRGTSRPVPTGNGCTWELGWRTPAWGAAQTCVLTGDTPPDGGRTLYRRTQDSPRFHEFNRTLYARLNTPTGCALVMGPFALTVAADGTSNRCGSAAETLRSVFGWSGLVVDTLASRGALG